MIGDFWANLERMILRKNFIGILFRQLLTQLGDFLTSPSGHTEWRYGESVAYISFNFGILAKTGNREGGFACSLY